MKGHLANLRGHDLELGELRLEGLVKWGEVSCPQDNGESQKKLS